MFRGYLRDAAQNESRDAHQRRRYHVAADGDSPVSAYVSIMLDKFSDACADEPCTRISPLFRGGGEFVQLWARLGIPFLPLEDIVALAVANLVDFHGKKPIDLVRITDGVPDDVQQALSVLSKIADECLVRRGFWAASRLDANRRACGVRLLKRFRDRGDPLLQMIFFVARRTAVGVHGNAVQDWQHLLDVGLQGFTVVRRLIRFMIGELTGVIVHNDDLFAVDNGLYLAAAGCDASPRFAHQLVLSTWAVSPWALRLYRRVAARDDVSFMSACFSASLFFMDRIPSLRSSDTLDVYAELIAPNGTMSVLLQDVRRQSFPERHQVVVASPTNQGMSCSDVGSCLVEQRNELVSAVDCEQSPSSAAADPEKHAKRRRAQVTPPLDHRVNVKVPRTVSREMRFSTFVHNRLDDDDKAVIVAFVTEKRDQLTVRGLFHIGARLVTSAAKTLWRVRMGDHRLFFVIHEMALKFVGDQRRTDATYSARHIRALLKVAQEAPGSEWTLIE